MQTGPFQPRDVVDVDRFRMKMLRALRCLRDAGRSAEDGGGGGGGGGDGGSGGGGGALYTEDVGRVFRQTLVMNPKCRCALIELKGMISELIVSENDA